MLLNSDMLVLHSDKFCCFSFCLSELKRGVGKRRTKLRANLITELQNYTHCVRPAYLNICYSEVSLLASFFKFLAQGQSSKYWLKSVRLSAGWREIVRKV